MAVFINLSNHPSEGWGDAQREAALALAPTIIDVPFPPIDPDGDEQYIAAMATHLTGMIVAIVGNRPAIAHVMGESGLVVELVSRLQIEGVTCVHSTTRRVATEEGGVKTSSFEFVKFRRYAQDW